MRLKFKESKILKGGMAVLNQTCLPGKQYDFSKEEGERLLDSFPDNFEVVKATAAELKAAEKAAKKAEDEAKAIQEKQLKASKDKILKEAQSDSK